MRFSFNWDINWAEVLQTMFTIGLIILIAYAAYFIAKSIINKTLNGNQKKDKGKAHRLNTLKTLINNIILYVILFVALITILSELNVDATGILASAGVIGLAIGIGAKDLISDVANGFFTLIEDQVNVGEFITVNGYSGVVEEVGLRVLRIRGVNGDLHFISNREIQALTNHSRGNMQALVDISIPSNVDVEQAIKGLQETCSKLKEKYEDLIEGPNVIGVQDIKTDEYVIRVIARTKNGKQFDLEREIQKEILKTNFN